MGLPAEQLPFDATVPFDRFRVARRAAEVLRAEADALHALAKAPPAGLAAAVDLIAGRSGVVVTGMGKAGLVGGKIAATLASLGTPAQTLHPAEALHGDLGMVRDGAVVLALSHSGETGEVVRLLAPLARRDVPVVAVTAEGRQRPGPGGGGGDRDRPVPRGRRPRPRPHRLHDRDARAGRRAGGAALRTRRLSRPTGFAAFHPAGALGRRLVPVREVMRTGAALRVFPDTAGVRAVLGAGGRRTGAVMLTGPGGELTGVFTDGDLARLLAGRGESRLDGPVGAVMTRDPVTIGPHESAERAAALLADRKLSELPVVDAAGRPAGLVDVTDLIGLA